MDSDWETLDIYLSLSTQAYTWVKMGAWEKVGSGHLPLQSERVLPGVGEAGPAAEGDLILWPD